MAEEIKFDPKVMVDKLDRRQTFHQAQLEDGDILLVQPVLSEVPLPCFLAQHLLCEPHTYASSLLTVAVGFPQSPRLPRRLAHGFQIYM